MNSTSCEHSVAYAAIMMPNMGLLRRLAQVKTHLGKTDDALALAERGGGDQDSAFLWARRLLADFLKDPVGHVQLASLHQTAGRPDDAKAALLRGVEVAQTPAASVLPMHRLSDLAARRGDIAEAFRWSRRAVEAAPNEPKTDMSRLAKFPISTGETRSSGSPDRRPGTFEQRRLPAA